MQHSKAVFRVFAATAFAFAMIVSPLLAPLGPAPEEMSIMAANEGNIHVNVTDEAGRTISGANVTIMGNASFWEFTGSDGSILIENITIGSYTINATKTGYLNGSSVAVVTQGSVSNITVIVDGGEFAGFILNQDNVPIENATVEVAIGAQIIQTLSHPNGSFNLTGIPTGSYIAVVFAPSYSATSEVISVTAGATTIHTLPIKLLMYTGWITGYIFDNEGPIPGARVSIIIDSIEHTVKSSDVGGYEMPGVPGGNYTVFASKDGYLDAELVNVTVENGYETRYANLTLVGKPATISGSVVAITSEGSVLLYGALVEVLGTGRNATTGTQGLYEIGNVRVGTWTIKVTAAGYLDNETSGVAIARGAKVPFNVRLTPKPGQLMGAVRDAKTFELLVGYRVAISGPAQRETFTNDQGQYVFAGLAPGNYTLTVTGPASDSKYSPYVKYNIKVSSEDVAVENVNMQLVKQALGGFIFGLDLAHSFMALAFIITMILLTLAVFIRLKKIQRAEKEIPPVTEIIEENKGGEKPPAQ